MTLAYGFLVLVLLVVLALIILTAALVFYPDPTVKKKGWTIEVDSGPNFIVLYNGKSISRHSTAKQAAEVIKEHREAIKSIKPTSSGFLE